MNKKAFVISLLMAVLIIFGLGSCLSNKGPNKTNNSKNNLDWEGLYTGSFVTNSGHTMNVRLRLNRDQSFDAIYEYPEGEYNSYSMWGPFKWDETGSIIMIDLIDAPIQYRVVKDKLIRLNAYDYVLAKVH